MKAAGSDTLQPGVHNEGSSVTVIVSLSTLEPFLVKTRVTADTPSAQHNPCCSVTRQFSLLFDFQLDETEMQHSGISGDRLCKTCQVSRDTFQFDP